MPRLRRLAPWLLAAIALAAALAPHVPKDIITLPRLALALAVLAAIALAALLIRRLSRPRPAPDPHAAAALLSRRALARALAAARRALGGPPARTWLVLGPARHGKTALTSALLGELRDLTVSAPGGAPIPRCLVAPDTRTLVLEHPGPACDLRPLLALPRPLDAILLVLSLPDLTADLDLQALRARLDDAVRALSVDIPIHLVCTRLDRLAGHAELVGDDRSAWGLSLATPDHLPAALRTWSRWVDAQRLARLPALPLPDARARLFTFAAAFARACDRLVDLAALLDPAQDPATPRPRLALRSVFFTAARPDPHTPQDRVLHHLAARLHLPLPAPPQPPPHAPTSPLVPQPALLSALLAHDPESARTPDHHRRLVRRRQFAAALLSAAALAIFLTAPAAATNRRTCLQDLADLTAPLVTTEPPATPRSQLDTPTSLLTATSQPDTPTSLLTATSQLDTPPASLTPTSQLDTSTPPLTAPSQLDTPTSQLDSSNAPLTAPSQPDTPTSQLDSSTAPLTATSQPDTPPALLPADTTEPQLAALAALHARLSADDCAAAHDLPAVFRRAVRRHLLHPLYLAHARALARLAVHPPVAIADQLLARDRLRAYLLLTADLSEAPGPLDPAQKDWLGADLPRRWSAERPGSPDLAPLFATFLALASATDFAFPRDAALVDRVRQQLAAHSDDDATLEAALASADCEPLALRNLTHAAQLLADRTLPCAFTRPGWDHVQRHLAAAVDRHDGWILGRPGAEPRDQRLARLRDRYDARYIQAWTEFLAGVRVRRPTDHASAARLLAELTEGDRPLARVFAGLEHHTRGLGRSRADLPTWLPGDAPGEVHRAFAPLLAFTVAQGREPGLARYHARLAEVLAALEAARSDPAALPALRTQISAALADTDELLRHADLRRFRPLLTALLLPPLDALQSAVTDQDKLALVRTYCHVLHAPLRQLTRRYPFDPAAQDDAPLADFTALFHPDTGAIARLRDGDLAPHLTGHGDDLTAAPARRTDPHPLDPRVVTLLRRAATLATLAFPKGQLGLALDVDLRCNADIGRVTFTLGAARHTYTCGPDPRAHMQWPGEPADARPGAPVPPGADLELLGRDGRRQQLPGHGPWGLWRLLEKDGVVTPPDDWTRDPLVFRFDLRASRLGTLDLALTPARTGGATLLYGPTPAGPALLAPLRAPELQTPPDTLFHGLPGCTDLDP